MTHLVSAEALKLRTLLLPRLALIVAALGSGLIGFAAVSIATDVGETVTPAHLVTAPAQTLWFVAVIVAVLASAGEFQRRTIRTTLLHAPRRGRVMAAKAMVTAAYGAVITLAGTASAVAVGVVSLRAEGLPVGSFDADMWVAAAGSAAIGALWALLAAGLGMLARNSTVAVVAVLLWRLVLEGLMPVVTGSPDITRWLPGGAANALLFGRDDLLEPWAGGLLFAGYAAVIAVAGYVLFALRDPA
jgi:ABC-2 type transport system permease protein